MAKSSKKLDQIKLSYDTAKDDFISQVQLKFPEKIKTKIANRSSTKGYSIETEHKAWEFSYNTTTKDLLGKVKFFLPNSGDKSYIKVSQRVAGLNFEPVPNPEIQLQMELFDKPNFKDVFELKFDFAENRAIYEHTFKLGGKGGRKQKIGYHINSIDQLKGVQLQYNVETGNKLVEELWADYSRGKGLFTKVQIRPRSVLKLKLTNKWKAPREWGFEIDAKPSKDSKVALEARATAPMDDAQKRFKFKPKFTVKYDM